MGTGSQRVGRTGSTSSGHRGRARRPAPTGAARLLPTGAAEQTKTTPTPPRKEPRQERARQTMEAILEATTELVARDGWAKTTTNHIARRAGVSIGSVYQYFPNKTAILVRLFERHVALVQPVVARFLDDLQDHGCPVERSLRDLFVRLVAAHSVHPGLNRVLEEEVPRPRALERQGRQRGQALVEEVAQILRARPDVRVRQPLVAARVLEQTAEGLIRWMVHSAPESLDREAFIDESVRMLSAYLHGGESLASTPSAGSRPG